ncbi:MAG: 16S rRNA (cytosine(1402)-N(4))-methyltransferase RsmH [Coriobacteriales bacterium]|nr:16S rRNA (cytosine(1402)-N(4))-methyltransferase RsmH [Coriobacteriales bacterium]
MKVEYRHIPVLADECIKALNLKPTSIFVDATLGGAGHSFLAAEIIKENGLLIGIDQDEDALTSASQKLSQVHFKNEPKLVQNNFENLDEILLELNIAYIDAILFDLGVSSFQFDEASRGFSYRYDAPLDMRMNANQVASSNQLNTKQIMNTYNENELAKILHIYDQEKFAKQIANNICIYREKKSIDTTFELVEIIKQSIPAKYRRSKGHPAKKTFQAIRIEVNHELDALQTALQSAIRWLAPNGKIAVISYHSLEDKIVKNIFRASAQACTCPPDFPKCVCGNTPIISIDTKRAIIASESEIEFNNRAHSAKLRVATKL